MSEFVQVLHWNTAKSWGPYVESGMGPRKQKRKRRIETKNVKKKNCGILVNFGCNARIRLKKS